MEAMGVYIGADCEIVLTETYLMIFRRNNTDDYLESRLFRRTDAAFSCIGICRTSPTETEQNRVPKLWRYAFAFSGETQTLRRIYREGQTVTMEHLPIYDEESDPEIGAFIGTSLKLRFRETRAEVSFEDGIVYELELDEELTTANLTPSLPDIREENVGECLRLWNIGVCEEVVQRDGVSIPIGVTINTARHMYIFEMTPFSVYCRAARYVTTNRGVVFGQNFRQGVEAYMLPDNREASKPLEIDETLFSSTACVWNSRNVYWSVVSYSDTEIVLNGCQGEQYHWKKPVR